MPRRRSRYFDDDDSESSVSLSSKSACVDSDEDGTSSYGSDASSEGSQDNRYRENDSFYSSDNDSVSDEDEYNDERSSGDESDSANKADVGSAKQFYVDEKRHGSVLKEKKHEHISLLRAMAIGLEDDFRQDDRFNSCVENGFVKKKDVEILKRHLYAEAKRRSSGSLKALGSWKVNELIDHLQNQQNKVKEKDEIFIAKTIDLSSAQGSWKKTSGLVCERK